MKYIVVIIRFFRGNGPEIQQCAQKTAELGAALMQLGSALAGELKSVHDAEK